MRRLARGSSLPPDTVAPPEDASGRCVAALWTGPHRANDVAKSDAPPPSSPSGG